MKNGAPTVTTAEPFSSHSYLTVFIKHFLAFPSQNFRILRKLFVENDWTATQIQKFTGWNESSVRTAAKKLELKKESNKPPVIGSGEPFGWKRGLDGHLTEHKSQQKIIDLALNLHLEGKNFNEICKILDEKKVKPKKGGKWERGTLKRILTRERKEQMP